MNIKGEEKSVEELKERLKLLEEENDALSNQVEDTILFGLISESFDTVSQPVELMRGLLEKISILKSIPLCFSIHLKKKSYKTLGSYCSVYSSEHGKPLFTLSREFQSAIHNESFLRYKYADHPEWITLHISEERLQPNEVLILSFENHGIDKGFFIFINEEGSDSNFGNDLLIFHQFVKMVGDKWERLDLLNQLTKLNRNLENKVKQRTSELTRINELLFNEIQDKQAINIELKIEKEKFHQLFNQANAAIYLWELDANGKVRGCIEANQAATNMTGYTLEDLSSMTPGKLMANDYKKQEKSLLKDIDFKKTITFEVFHQRKDGSVFPVEVNAHQFTLNDKEVVLSITHDITERKRIEEALIKAKEKAEESDMLKSSFLANMSHEIRTPMNAILGFAEILQHGGLVASEIQDFTNIILNNGVHLLNLINDIVDFSKIESGQVTINKSAVNTKALMENLQMTTKSLLRNYDKEHIQVQILIAANIDNCIIETDEVKLRQILSNLMNNAVKFTKRGTITLGLERPLPDQLNFYVSDTGVGIPSKFHAKIFERFVRVKDKKTFNIPGTGLGLAISQNLAEMLGGQLKLDFSTVKGTRFSFEIPCIETKD